MRRNLAWSICLLPLLAAAFSNYAGRIGAPGELAASATSVSGATASDRVRPIPNPVAQRPLTQGTYPPSADGVRFGRLSVEQGLSHSTVTSILQDRYGFMWFGTRDGLNRYDGDRFAVFRHDPENPDTLSDSLITTLYEDAEGTLWIGTERGGLNRYERGAGRFVHYRHDPTAPSSLASDTVRAIHEDRAGTLWIGTESGATRFDRGAGRFTDLRANPDAPLPLREGAITAIHESAAGLLWFGTDQGLVSYDPGAGRFTWYQHNPANPDTLSHDQATAIHEDNTGRLWIGALGGGFGTLDTETGRFTRLSEQLAATSSEGSARVSAIFQDHTGSIWIGSQGGGLARFDPQANTLARFVSNPDDASSLSNNMVLTIYEDASGVVWIGTQGGGVSTFNRQSNRFAHYRHIPGEANSLRANGVTAICEDPVGLLWIGTDDGLDSLDRRTGQYTHYPTDPTGSAGLSSPLIRAIHRDSKGVLWVATEGGGLNRLDPGATQFTYYGRDPEEPTSLASNNVAAIFEDASGALWFGTDNGLDRFDRRADTFIHFRRSPGNANSLSSNDIWTIHGGQDDALWVGARAGLNRVDRSTGKTTRYLVEPDAPGSVSDNAILAIHQGRSGALWVGLLGGGLTRLDPATGETIRYRERDGLPNDTVYGILEDEGGALWLSTNKGIARFDPISAEFTAYDRGDGLQGNEFNRGAFAQGADGELFFGGTNGLTAFKPAEMRANTYAPPVALTTLTQEGKAIATDRALEEVEALTLRWPHNAFEFEFAALNYVQPEKNHVAYQLAGFDQDWKYAAGQGIGRYTNLPGGAYSLRLKGSNNDGAWNEEGRTIKITVAPPFWRTWWFIGLATLALAASVAGGYRWRLRSVEARNQALAVEVAERTLQIAQRTADIEALYQADAELDRHVALGEVLQSLVDIAVEQLGAEKSAVLCWDGRRERIVMRAARGFSPAAMRQLTFAPGEGITGQVMTTGEPAIVEDAATDPRGADRNPELKAMALVEGVRSFMHLPIRLDSATFGIFNVSYTAPRGFGEREQRIFTALAQRAAIAVENASHFDAEHRRAEQLGVINEVGRHITSILDVDEVLQEIVGAIQGRFEYQVVSIALVEDAELVIRASAPVRLQELGIPPLRVKVAEEGVIGWVAGVGIPLLIPDVSQEPRYLAWPHDITTRSELAVPMLIQSRVIGVLNIESTELNAFDDSDLIVVQALANQAAIAVENAQLYARAQEVAALRERGRLARDLHDAVTQTLFSASLIAEVLPALWEADRSEGEQMLCELRSLTRGALAEMRTLLLELRPAALVEANLGDLLRQLAESVSGRSGIPVIVTVEGCLPPDLPDDVHIAFYRIAQEALNNVVKHARASRAEVKLRCAPPACSSAPDGAPASVELLVSDDGRGFDPENILPDHLGLGIIHERAQAIRAELSIRSRPGQGSTVKVTWKNTDVPVGDIEHT